MDWSRKMTRSRHEPVRIGGAAWTSIEWRASSLSPDDEATYREAARLANLRNGTLLLLGGSAALLLWWSTDGLVFSHEPLVRARLNFFRPLLIASALLIVLLLRNVPSCARQANATLAIGGAWLMTILGIGFGLLGNPSSPWFHLFDLAIMSTAAFSAGTRGRLLVSGTLAVLMVATYFGPHPSYWQDPMAGYAVSLLAFGLLMSVGAGLWGERLRREFFFLHRELGRQAAGLEARVREQTRELQELTAYNESAREQERAWLSRELHDELGQELTALGYALSLAELRFQEEPLAIAPNLRELNEHLHRTKEATRRVVSDLRPRVLDDLGLAAAAAWLVQRTRTRTAIECRLELSPRLESLPGEVAVTAFRILQESLTNVSRHSRATHAEISIHLAEDGLLLRVADDGIGLQRSRSAPGAAPRGMGLIGMRERARALGGEASVTESSAGGTVVEVRLQVAQARGESVQ